MDTPVRPFEEYLGDQIVRGGVSVLSNEPVRYSYLTSPIDIEGSERDVEAFR